MKNARGSFTVKGLLRLRRLFPCTGAVRGAAVSPPRCALAGCRVLFSLARKSFAGDAPAPPSAHRRALRAAPMGGLRRPRWVSEYSRCGCSSNYVPVR
jgi:hypothetical protein